MDRPKKYTELQVQTVCLVVLTAFTIGIGLYLLRPILVPFMLAVFLAFMLTPVLDLQTRFLRIPRLLALFITLVVAMAVLTFGTGATVSSITQLANNSESLQTILETRIREAFNDLPLNWLGLKKGEPRAPEPPGAGLRDIPLGAPAETPAVPNSGSGDDAAAEPSAETHANPAESVPLEQLNPETTEQFDPMSLFPENLIEWILTRLTTVLTTVASQGILVLLFVIFLLLGRSAQPKPTEGVVYEIERSVKRYIITKVIVSAVTGVLVFFVLNMLGIPFAIAFGALAFMLNFIPSIGSIIATLLPVPVLLLTRDISTLTFALAIVLPGIIQFTIGNLIEPKVMGDSLDLHPVVILSALIFWGMIWGPIGMLLAAPLTAITKIALSKIELTQPLADALAGRVPGLLEIR
jgi:AI-2 transport protein TqsA